MTQFIQHTTNPTTVEVCVMYFAPGDARHWIPSGTEHVECIVDKEDLADDPIVAMSDAGERWCEQVHGPGAFFSVVLGDE